LEAEHQAYELFEESVSFTSTSPTASDVLTDALTASNIGGSFTLTFAASDVTLGDDYEADNRPLKRVFRDITDRTGTVWWVAGASDEITVDNYGGRGLWESITTATDTARVLSFDPDNVKTVVNDVTVNGTGGERVTGTATDATSISTYGRRSQTVNVSYITSQTEADDYASALLKPDPLPEAELLVGGNVGTSPESNLSNFEVAVDDSNGTGLNDTLVVEKQTIEQGQVRFDLGEGRATSVARFNRSEKSKQDTTEPGSVYNSDRIADGAIGDTKLVDLSVTEEKLADLAVSLNKLQDNAVVEGKLADLSVSETKVQDDAISTPKLVAEAVTANEIDANTITANEIAAGTITAFEIEAGTITTNEIDTRTIRAINIATDELTANEIDAMDLDTNQLAVGAETNSEILFTEIDSDTAIVPETDGSCQVGDDFQRFNVMNAINAQFDNLQAESTTTDSLTIDEDITDPIVTTSGPEGTEFLPENANTCLVGNTVDPFEAVVANNLIEQTPEPLDAVDASEITGYSWRNPPQYVAQLKSGANRDTEYHRHNPNNGVELGHMANYLFEVCKDQQSKIESLESRIESLEAAISE